VQYHDDPNHKPERENARHTGLRHAEEDQRIADTRAELWHLWARVDSSSIAKSLLELCSMRRTWALVGNIPTMARTNYVHGLIYTGHQMLRIWTT
jgi:hypothetical protein